MTELRRSRFHRAWGLGQLGARFAAGHGRRLLRKDQALAHQELAQLLVRELGQMKGLPMKLGQMLSYMAGFVPPEYQEVYRRSLAELRTTSPAIDQDAMEAVLTGQLGDKVDVLFEDFDWTPIASASIGQVYSARFEGRNVCVKIQYPGISEATESDLRNINAIVGIMRVVLPTVDAQRIVEDFQVRLREECDYEQEARYQTRFAKIYADDSRLKVPNVINERSTARVLTTERIEGIDLETFVEDADDRERTAAAEALFHFAFETLLSHRLFHADPHPGNLLFRCDDRLGVLDFGCVQPIDSEARRDLAALLRAAINGADLRAPTMRLLRVEDIDSASEAAVVKIASEIFAPLRAPQPYRFTPEFATQVMRDAVEAKTGLSFKYLTRRGRFGGPREGITYIARSLFGLTSLWGELKAEVNFQALASDILDRAQASTA